MTQKFKVGDRVKALAYTDSSGKNHAEVTGLIVDSVTRHGGVHGVAPYDRLNCYAADLGDRLARRRSSNEAIQVEAAARFFAHDSDSDNLASLQSNADAGVFDNEREFQSTRLSSDITV